MIRNYIKTAVRIILKQPVLSAINIFGLAIGITSVILITFWIQDELSFDKFHNNRNEIYRIVGNNSTLTAPKPLASLIKEDIPEIVNSSRLMQVPGFRFEYNKTIFNETPLLVGDSFFEIFSFPFIQGNSVDALRNPSSIVITQDLAQRMFGDKYAIGQTITMNLLGREQDLTISGIIENIPSNSHLEASCFISILDVMQSLFNDNFQNWSAWSSTTYIQIQKGADIKEIEGKINSSIIAHSNDESDYRVQQLQPLDDIHLFSSFKKEYAKCGDIKYIYIFSFIAFIITLIACINYVNLTTSLGISRFMEIRIKKVLGSSRISLIKQFFVESFITSTIASIIVIIIILIIVPGFNNLSNKSLEITISNLSLIFFVFGAIIATGMFSGLFPALFLSSFGTKTTIQPEIGNAKTKSSIRKILPVIQLSLSIVLIIGAITIKKQMVFIHNMNIGFDKEHLVYFNIMNNSNENIELIKSELLKNPSISNVTSGHLWALSNNLTTSDIDWVGRESEEQISTSVHRVDYDFQNTYKVKMLEGRFFSEEMPTDKYSAYILNEAAVKEFNINNPLDNPFSLWNQEGTIIGVMEDYHFETAHKQVSPVVLSMNTERSFVGFESITLRILSDNFRNTLQSAQELIQTYNNGYKPEYQFFDENIDKFYKSEESFLSIINMASILAILISCLGLLGFIIHTSKLRFKEIGIRKINGAKVSEILAMLNKDFIKWVAIAFIIATPIAYYAMNKWLENFAYKTTLSWWIFGLAGILALGIALLTVSWQSWRAATRNPVESLRYE